MPYAVTFAAVTILPLLSIEAMTVEPYLNTSFPPDSWIVKFVVVRLVTAPPSVILPVDVTVPDKLKPLADPVPETEVTVPVPVADKTPPANVTPVPMVTLLNPPAPLPYKREDPDVAGA